MRLNPSVCFQLGLVASLVLAAQGCAHGGGIHGGKVVGGDAFLPETKTIYAAPHCKNVATGEASDGARAAYFVVHDAGQPAIRERDVDSGSGTLITNHWSGTDGDHYFLSVDTNGWEYVVPASGDGEKRVYNHVEVTTANGVIKPTSPVAYICALKLIE